MITIRRIFTTLRRWITRAPVEAGKRFEEDIAEALNRFDEQNTDFWFHRYYDFRLLAKMRRRGMNVPVPRMVADYEALHKGQFYAIECKTTKTPRRYGMQYIKEHQIQSALEIERAGGVYWILVCRRFPYARLYALRPGDWLHLKKIAESKGYKSVSWESIENNSIELFKTDGIWDLSPLFKALTERIAPDFIIPGFGSVEIKTRPWDTDTMIIKKGLWDGYVREETVPDYVIALRLARAENKAQIMGYEHGTEINKLPDAPNICIYAPCYSQLYEKLHDFRELDPALKSRSLKPELCTIEAE